MNERKRKVAVFGAVNVDIGGRPQAAFVPGDSIPGTVSVALGGVGFNIARNAASLGAETAFFSVLGEDEHAPAIRAEAARFGVSIAGCRWERAANNRYVYIIGQGGEMAAAINDMRLCERMDEAFIRERLPMLEGFGAVCADANLPPETFRVLAENACVPLVADCVSAAKCGRLRPCLPYIHTLKANRMEAKMLTGRIEPEACAQALLEEGVRRVVISLGAEGVLCAEAGSVCRLPAIHTPAVDVTGAGDSLTAALAVGLARDMPAERCVSLGVRAAAVTMSRHGAVTEELSTLQEEFL